MRVLHLIPSLGGGGAERQLALLAPAIAQLGCTVGVAFHTGGPNLNLLKTGRAELLPLPKRSNHHPMRVWDLISLVQSWKPDVIHTWLTQMDILGGLVARIARKPHVLSERSSAKMYMGGWKDKVRIVMGQTARAIITNSEGGAEYWRGLAFRNDIAVIPNAMQPLAAVQPPHPWDGRRYFISAGRLSPEKNPLTAFKAMLAALEAMPAMHAIHIGDGPERDFAAELISKSKAEDRFRISGYSTKLDVWLRHATAFISTSYVEGHPNVVMEAAQARCPLILSDIPAHHNAVGDGAIYADLENIDQFSSALIEAVEPNSMMAQRIAIAHQQTESLGLDVIAERYLKFYEHCLKANEP